MSILTTIQKFTESLDLLTDRDNVICISDEAHRSQYSSTAANLRVALPNATFIGFTGTPIDKEDKSTPRTFGSYIDKYSIKDAVVDGATVKIVYEGRKPDLHIKDNTLELYDPLNTRELASTKLDELAAFKEQIHFALTKANCENTITVNFSD